MQNDQSLKSFKPMILEMKDPLTVIFADLNLRPVCSRLCGPACRFVQVLGLKLCKRHNMSVVLLSVNLIGASNCMADTLQSQVCSGNQNGVYLLAVM